MGSVEQNLARRFAGSDNFHDISNVYDESTDSMFMDLCHTNQQGYRMVAERMLPAITVALDKQLSSQNWATP